MNSIAAEEAGFLSDPSIVHLRSLLSEVHRGLIQLPAFQRGLVWRMKDRLQLLDSVYRGIPIGTIMIWRTTLQQIRVLPNVGPHLVEDPKPILRQLVIDGGQRIASLYGSLYHIAPEKFANKEVEEPLESFVVYADVSRDDIQFATASTDPDLILKSWFPVELLFDSAGLLRWLRQHGDAGDRRAARIDDLAARFRDYKLPVVAAGGDDLSIAINTFQRVNRAGTMMSDVHMIRALSWSENFDLTARFEEGRRSVLVERGWQDVDDELLLKCLRVALDQPIYEEKASASEDFAKKVAADSNLINSMFEALGRAVDFLRLRCGILIPLLLPYSVQLPCLIAAFSKADLKDSVLEKIEAWLWLTTYAELFASISGYRLNVVVDRLRDLADVDGAGLVWPGTRAFSRKALPPKFDFRHARARALAVRLAELQEEGPELLSTMGPRSLSSLTPRESGHSFSRPGAKFLIRPLTPVQLKNFIESADGSIFPQHCLSNDAVRLIRKGDIGQAIEQRSLDLEQLERDFVRRFESHIVAGPTEQDQRDQLLLFDE